MDEFDLDVAAYCLPDARADGGVRTVRFVPHGVRIDRAVAGIKMHLAIPIEAYQSILITPQDEDRRLCRIELAHRDPDLSLRFDPADIELCQRWLCLLPAPAQHGGSAKRRRSATLAKRRPRILLRRRPGRPQAPAKILRCSRELFSRE
jgi:hypothetical protein